MNGTVEPSGAAAPAGVTSPGWHRTVMAVVASAGLLAFIAWKVEPVRLWEVLRQTRPAFVVLAFLSAGGGLLMVACRWHWMLLLRGVADRWWDSVRTALIGYGLSMVLPGAVFADVAKSFQHARRHGRPFEELLLVCGLDRFAGMLGLGVYGLLIAGVTLPLASPWIRWEAPRGAGRSLVGGILAATVVGILIAVSARRPRVRAAMERGRQLVRDGWGALRDRPVLLVAAAGLSVLGNLLVAATLALGLASVAPEPLPWGRVLWTLPVIGLAAAFPFTVAGAGAREGAAIALWSACGIAAPVAVAACLVTLSANLVWAAIGGLLLSTATAARRHAPAPRS